MFTLLFTGEGVVLVVASICSCCSLGASMIAGMILIHAPSVTTAYSAASESSCTVLLPLVGVECLGTVCFTSLWQHGFMTDVKLLLVKTQQFLSFMIKAF